LRFANSEVQKDDILADVILHEAKGRLPLPERPCGRSTLPQGEG
jgi:hypothetical protein